MAKSPNKSKKTAPPQDPYDRLSFIANRNKAGLPDGRFPRCFWNVKATGRYAEDCDTGQKLALEFLNFPTSVAGPLLVSIVGDMPQPLTGVEVGFLETVGDVAKAGHRDAIRLSVFWTGPAKRRAA